MIVDHLRVANLRIISDAEFNFAPGLNLLVGSNGVGKTTILNALSTCLNEIVKHANKLKSHTKRLGAGDIRVGAHAFEIECGFRIDDRRFSYILHEPRTSNVPQKGKGGRPREQVYDTPKRSEFIGALPLRMQYRSVGARPLALLFSTNRAVPTRQSPRKGTAAGGIAGACADALSHRELRLAEISAWMKAQELMRSEREAAATILDTCQHTVTRFLPNYTNLRVGREDDPLLLIDRDATTVPVEQLSDGERGILALVLDLTRRLAQANPELTSPATEAGAVVLIDELELHLHPKWQRRIVNNLTSAFPRCQFIATTHSPQIIGEVPHDRIQIISDGMVYTPSHSLGVDSSRVLEEIMDANPRAERVNNLLSEVHAAMDLENIGPIGVLLEQLIEVLGEGDPEITRIQTFLDLMEEE